MHISGGRYPLAGRVALWAVPRRIEIELTSQRDDGTWTWRAAGARRPKGEVSGDLVPDAAAVGSVLRAEVDGGLDGLEILALFAPRARPEPSGRQARANRRRFTRAGPLVTTALVSGSRRNSRTDRGAQREGAAPSRERRRTDDKGVTGDETATRGTGATAARGAEMAIPRAVVQTAPAASPAAPTGPGGGPATGATPAPTGPEGARRAVRDAAAMTGDPRESPAPRTASALRLRPARGPRASRPSGSIGRRRLPPFPRSRDPWPARYCGAACPARAGPLSA